MAQQEITLADRQRIFPALDAGSVVGGGSQLHRAMGIRAGTPDGTADKVRLVRAVREQILAVASLPLGGGRWTRLGSCCAPIRTWPTAEAAIVAAIFGQAPGPPALAARMDQQPAKTRACSAAVNSAFLRGLDAEAVKAASLALLCQGWGALTSFSAAHAQQATRERATV